MQPPVNTQRLENIRSSSARPGFAAASPQHKARGQKRGSIPHAWHVRKPPRSSADTIGVKMGTRRTHRPV